MTICLGAATDVSTRKWATSALALSSGPVGGIDRHTTPSIAPSFYPRVGEEEGHPKNGIVLKSAVTRPAYLMANRRPWVEGSASAGCSAPLVGPRRPGQRQCSGTRCSRRYRAPILERDSAKFEGPRIQLGIAALCRDRLTSMRKCQVNHPQRRRCHRPRERSPSRLDVPDLSKVGKGSNSA